MTDFCARNGVFLLPGASRLALFVATAALLVGLVACGSQEPERPPQQGPSRLTAQERSSAGSGYRAIRSYCRRLGLHFAGRRERPGRRTQARALGGARTIAELAARKPTAQYAPNQTARQLAGDTAEDLEGTNCSARLVLELRRGL